MNKKMTEEEFVTLAVVKLRLENYRGIHSVYSGFNEAFKTYYEGRNPVEATDKLAADKKIVIRPVKGGVMLYLPGETPGPDRGEEALRKMGLLERPSSGRA